MKKLWNKNYILLLQGSAVSAIGDVLYSICIAYWVYEKTESTALMAIVESVSMIMTMCFSPICGTFADKLNKRNIVVAMDALRGIFMILLGIICLAGKMTIPMILFVAVISSLCQCFFSPASTTLYVDIIPASELVRGQSIHSGLSNLISLTGKAVSGVLIVTFGVPLLILLNGFSFVISAITEAFIQIDYHTNGKISINIKSIFHDLKEGLISSITTKGLRIFLLIALAGNLFGAGYMALILPICYAKGLTVLDYSTVSVVMTAGSFAGIALCGIVKFKKEHKPFIIVFSMLISGMGTIAFLLLNNYLVSLVCLFISYFMNSIGNALLGAALLLLIDEKKRGVVFGFVQTFSTGGTALSTLAYGFLAEIFPIITLSVIGTILASLPILMIYFSKEVKETLATVE